MTRLLRRAGVAAGTLLAALTLGCATPASTPTNQDADAIRGTLVALNAACAARDLPAFMALFDDDDAVVFVGSAENEVFRGKAAAGHFMQVLFELPFTFSFDLKDTTIRQTGDTAWVFVDGHMIRTGDRGGTAGKVVRDRYRFSIAMVRKDGRWRWQLFHGSVPGRE
jgi:uncharacterized protein (TIGR02246 family)